jgi:hypothetical protein
MNQFALELYFESEDDRALAERASAALKKLVGDIAPHVVLDVTVLQARSISRHRFERGGSHDVPHHGRPGRQTLLITREDIHAQGWGWPGSCVVSKQELSAKAASGGDMADILIHEWIHTIQGEMINGKAVPFADDAEKMGFTSTLGGDGRPTWRDWYRFALGA